jgi:AraC-like DNA-binding protein
LAQAAAGFDWTSNAQAAAFSNSAHLNRTMRRYFGIAPSTITAALRGV